MATPDDTFGTGYIPPTDLLARANETVQLVTEYGGVDGAHHKQWVLDQVMRSMLADKYEAWVAWYNDGPDGPDTYEWDTGIAP